MADVNYARFCDSAYGSADQDASLVAEHWRPLPAMPKAKLWVQGNLVVAAFRGTVPSDAADLADDALLAFGNEAKSLRFQSCRRWVLGLVRQHPHARVIVTGHSLGGSIALFCCYGVPAVKLGHCYNPFASSTMIVNSHVSRLVSYFVSRIGTYYAAICHTSFYDPINAGVAYMAQVTVDQRTFPGTLGNPVAAHLLSNWL